MREIYQTLEFDPRARSFLSCMRDFNFKLKKTMTIMFYKTITLFTVNYNKNCNVYLKRRYSVLGLFIYLLILITK